MQKRTLIRSAFVATLAALAFSSGTTLMSHRGLVVSPPAQAASGRIAFMRYRMKAPSRIN